MALRDQPYLPLYVQDFLTDEKLAECSAESNGVYIRIMCLMHKSEEYGTILLQQKYKQNSSTCLNFAEKLVSHLPYKVDVIARSLEELVETGVLTIDGDKMSQRRMVRDFAVSNARSEAGQKGGFAKANTLAKGVANTLANTEYENEYESEDVIDIKTKKKRIAKGKIDNTFFESFWSSYPKKLSRKDAEKAFAKTNPMEFETIMASLDKWKKSYEWAKDGGQYVPNAATWLNGERWNDEVPKGGNFTNQSNRKQMPTEYGEPTDFFQ